MKLRFSDVIAEYRRRRGDTTDSITSEFIIDAFNWGARELARAPGIGDRILLWQMTKSLAPRSKDGSPARRWDLTDYSQTDTIQDITMLNIWRSTTTKPEQMRDLTFLDPDEFYSEYPKFMPYTPGIPKAMTFDSDGDTAWLALDRPSSIPLFVDYRFVAGPKPVKKPSDIVKIPSVAYNTILDFLDIYYFMEGMDYALTDPTWSNIDKAMAEIRQKVNKMAYQKPFVLR